MWKWVRVERASPRLRLQLRRGVSRSCTCRSKIALRVNNVNVHTNANLDYSHCAPAARIALFLHYQSAFGVRRASLSLPFHEFTLRRDGLAWPTKHAIFNPLGFSRILAPVPIRDCDEEFSVYERKVVKCKNPCTVK